MLNAFIIKKKFAFFILQITFLRTMSNHDPCSGEQSRRKLEFDNNLESEAREDEVRIEY